MVKAAAILFLLCLSTACRRAGDTRADPPRDAGREENVAAKTVPSATPSTSAKETMSPELTPELKRVLGALRAASGHRGEVRGTFAELRQWIGPDARDWPLPEMLRRLEAAGEIAIHVLSMDAGVAPAFVVSAWKD